MKATLPPDEYLKRWQKNYYKKKKDEVKKKGKEKRDQEKREAEALFKEVLDEMEWPVDLDKFYFEKYKQDDLDSWWRFKYYWWASRLNFEKASALPKYKSAIRIYERKALNRIVSDLWKMQDRAYEYIKPHLNEISLKDFKLSRKQMFTKAPMRVSWWRMRELIEGTDISNNQICTVASALLRDKYIVNELYLWRVSFLIWDVIISQSGNVFRPMLENNIPWLTKDTVEELHKKRFERLNRDINDLSIYALWDAYLIKVHPNERETYFYIVPT